MHGAASRGLINMDNRAELVGIQFLRGFCALGVVVGHCAAMIADPKYGGLTLLGGALESGSSGVDIFFVISGFIMSVVVLKGSDLRPRMTLSAYATRRFVRIVPMMWLAILSYALLQRGFARDAIDWAAYARAAFLIPYSYVKPDIIWTLRQELIFYSLFALSFFGPRASRWLLLAWVVSPIAYVAFLPSWGATTGYIDSPWSILFSSVNIEFGMGVGLGLFWNRMSPPSDWRLPVHPFIGIGVLLTAILALYWCGGLISQTLPSVIFLGLCGTGLVLVSARSHCPQGWLTRLGGLLGDASYSIYLFHLHVLAGLLALRAKFAILPNAPLAILLAVLVATSLSILIHLLVEQPMTGWMRRALARRAKASPTGSQEQGRTPDAAV